MGWNLVPRLAWGLRNLDVAFVVQEVDPAEQSPAAEHTLGRNRRMVAWTEQYETDFLNELN